MIKLLADYSGAELEELTEDQAQRLVDLECADAGHPFAPERTISDKVWPIIYDAWTFKRDRERLIKDLDRCVDLAEGNPSIGLKFFTKANPSFTRYFDAVINADGQLVIVNASFENPWSSQ